MPRYLPVQPDAANEQVLELYERVKGQLGFVPNFIKTLAHSDHYVYAVAEAYQRLMGETGLPEKLRQLAILKTCKLNQCAYTVGRHTRLAREAGLSEEQLEALEEYAQSDLFTYYEKEVLQLAELVTNRPDDISDTFWTQLDNHFTSDQVVELVTLISFFNMLNRIILSLQIEPDPEPKQEAIP